ncbi:acyl-CoA dehydrogenase family protein [Nocardioides bizhenqiangii]|uniref:Acyl-CoA dehydrogenase family protein n=1 Tax=Nocardioides bizhenqiangii TaxID=3095076 RepID=A0ABZ0ZJZ3_9ACTN|nr:acyl-CoA dehydrogenase family protein [Nocardioides sp. HM61]WQQ24778.1 acyl-CoA dehydrogenase family protein [Nocardioides sp. HM61]
MEFALSEEQGELAATVRAVLTKQADPAAVRSAIAAEEGYDPALWSTLCEQVGVAALAIPEEYDGAGATFFETAIVLEELGRSLAPTPLLASAIAAEALLAGGTEEAKARLLPRIAAGEIATIAVGDGPVLDGDRAVIVLALDGDDLLEVTGAAATWAESMDQTIRLAHLDRAGATTTVVGDGAAARTRAELVGPAAAAALAVGLCDRALRMTVDYSKERVQFGRPIGSFQALKHRMAEMLARLEIGRSASWAASYALATDAAGAEVLTRTAASYCLEAAAHLAGECVQLHGGIAITWEHDAHLVFKRAHALGQLFGAPHHHRAAITV